jgi:hypothetical protein
LASARAAFKAFHIADAFARCVQPPATEIQTVVRGATRALPSLSPSLSLSWPQMRTCAESLPPPPLVFPRDRREQEAAVGDAPALLRLVRLAVAEVWASSAALPLKARHATSLIGADPWALDLALLHALDGRKAPLTSEEGFAQLVALTVSGTHKKGHTRHAAQVYIFFRRAHRNTYRC